jgi:thioesterase domain-containing protein
MQNELSHEAHAAIWTGILGVAKHLGKQDGRLIRHRHPLVQLRKGRAGAPMYFVGAGLSEFSLAQFIRSERSIFGIEVPWPSAWRSAAKENKTSAMPTMEQLAALYVTALKVSTRSSPCVLAGYSFNGLVAFEAAHQLIEQGGKVEMVILLDSWAQSSAKVAWQRLRKDWRRIPNRRSTTSETVSSSLRYSWSMIEWTLLKSQQQLKERFRVAMTGDLGPPTMRFDDLDAPLPRVMAQRLCHHALRNYRPRCLTSRGVLFRAQPADDEGPARILDGNLGWANLFSKGLEIVEVAGDHGTMLVKPHALVLARAMSELLNSTFGEANAGTRYGAHRPLRTLGAA